MEHTNPSIGANPTELKIDLSGATYQQISWSDSMKIAGGTALGVSCGLAAGYGAVKLLDWMFPQNNNSAKS